MKKTETRIVSRAESIAFTQNMQWFSGYGNVRVRALPDGQRAVTASRAAWSNWIPFKVTL